MEVSPAIVIACVFGLFILYILCRVFIRPLKWLFGLAVSCVIGCAVMLMLNTVLNRFGTGFCINPLTALISGVLGVPGLIMTLVLQAIL